MDSTNSLSVLQARLGYKFRDEALLRQALTHRSFGAHHNERLEFLGDAILNCVIASYLFSQFAQLDEGDLSRLRSNLVKQATLASLANGMDLANFLSLGEGERRSGGLRRPSILGDCMEALFGAVQLDGGFDAARNTVLKVYDAVLGAVDPQILGKDAKTLLQEHLQARKISLPVYQVVATRGAAHDQVFEVQCSVPKLALSFLGGGASRRSAEQAAAQLCLDHLLSTPVDKPTRQKRAA